MSFLSLFIYTFIQIYVPHRNNKPHSRHDATQYDENKVKTKEQVASDHKGTIPGQDTKNVEAELHMENVDIMKEQDD